MNYIEETLEQVRQYRLQKLKNRNKKYPQKVPLVLRKLKTLNLKFVFYNDNTYSDGVYPVNDEFLDYDGLLNDGVLDKVYSFFENKGRMFFNLEDCHERIYYYYGEDRLAVNSIELSKTEFGKCFFDEELSYSECQQKDLFLDKLPKRVAIDGINLKQFGLKGLLIGVYDNTTKPLIFRIEDYPSEKVRDVFTKSIKIGHHMTKLNSMIEDTYGFCLGGYVFDVTASFWLLMGLKDIPSIEKVSRFYGLGLWKNITKCCTEDMSETMLLRFLSYYLANITRNLFFVRNIIVPYIIQIKAISVMKKLNNMLSDIGM